MSEATFKELFFRGEIPFEEIDTYTDRWNFSDDTRTLASYLGLNGDEEDVWISQSDEALEDLLEQEKIQYQSCKTKLLFVDLDATLLSDDKSVSEGNKKAIGEAVAAGHKVILSSGRALSSTVNVAKKIGLDIPGCYVIAFAGAVIYDFGGKRRILDRRIPLDIAGEIEDMADEMGIYIHTYQDDYVLAKQAGDIIEEYKKASAMDAVIAERLSDALTKEPNKMLLVDKVSQNKINQMRERMEEKFPDDIDSFFSSEYYFEIVPKGVNKGSAIHAMANYLNIPMENTVAVGDCENDVAMLQEAGVSVAMCNGTDTVKSIADHITESDNNHDGVAEVIRRFILA